MADTADTLTVRYFAAAAAAAGRETETRPVGRVREIVADACAAHPDLRPVIAVCTFLLDGVTAREDTLVPAGATLDVLPPFAGG